ncbi:MAG: sigma 54-interacting transcriptional regulator [Gemmatimonadota bacterium]|nr:sigma 54-interacting transcriptional regulator [Gemmatimonadota bacterium]MDE2873044.1 sigma 54-interacting transcriptional regulator [Gemmatimonadota bacterium]
MTDFADRWKDEWNDLPEDMRVFATHAGPTDAHILLLGEPGSGKGYLARILHDLSSRAGGPFVPQNCGVFTESLAEAKLFGHVKGAYTGATESRAGLVEAAAGGTLFLDELGALPSAVQPMLLMFLETREFSRMGSTPVLKADVRVIAATNRDLGAAIAEGVFREDLVGRMSPRYKVPPLRERRRAIEGIVQRFLRQTYAETRVEWRLTETAAARLRDHDWPGNIRELLNVLRYCVMFAKDAVIDPDVVEKAIQNQRIGAKPRRHRWTAESWKRATDEEKRRMLAEALDAADGNVSEAARMLVIHRSTVYQWLKR